ncbi:conserved protein of unknown function [Methylocella tundrae]|uniref:Zinc/iron-chelating domain-containing protein n=1 Tax=Methylocella tundrae TaxID=227605 RepID=A0A4U8Z027_METTU|nr:conserved protein of unknown function [Methylocella tundrae]
MLPIPGKACGACSFCCKVLEIVEFEKPAGVLCENCLKSGGCGIYESRPDVCRDYECLWKGDRGLGAPLRPDRVGVILMEDPDSDEYRAVCDPAKPLAWRHPLVFQHLVAMARSGRIVVAKAGLKSLADQGQRRNWTLHLKRAERPAPPQNPHAAANAPCLLAKSRYKAPFAASAGG